MLIVTLLATLAPIAHELGQILIDKFVQRLLAVVALHILWSAALIFPKGMLGTDLLLTAFDPSF